MASPCQKAESDLFLSAAYHQTSQILPIGNYYINSDDVANKELDLLKARQWNVGISKTFSQGLNLKLEAYFQTLRNVPVSTEEGSTYWMLNDLVGYADEGLMSYGKGRNYGIEFSVEKYFKT